MAASGTIEINGRQYTWSSPRLRDLEFVEAQTRKAFPDMWFLENPVGWSWTLFACLREHQPELKHELLAIELRAADQPVALEVIRQAVPLWTFATSPAPSSSSPDGLPAAPEASASPTS